MDERILTETFNKITKQYIAIQEIFGSVDKPDGKDLSIEVCNSSDNSTVTSNPADNEIKKQRMLMRIKHIERYLTFITNHMHKVTATICDIPPYNVSLEILDGSSDELPDDWDRITEEVYNTLNIESDDEDELPDIDPAKFFEDDDDDPPLAEESGLDVEILDSCETADASNCSDDEELEVSEVEIDKVKYYTTDERCGKIYHILANEEVGKKVGVFNEGIATFY